MPKLELNKITLFNGLTQKELSWLKRFLLNKKYSAGDFIMTKGKLRDRLVIVVNGLVSLETKIDGEETIALFKNGEALGEMALIEKNGYHQHTLKAISDLVETLELSIYNWHTIIKKEPQIAKKIYSNTALLLKHRLTHANNKLVTLFSTGKIIGQYEDLEKIAKSIIKVILNIIPSQRALFITASPADNKIHLEENIGWSKLKKNTYYPLQNDRLLKLVSKEKSTIIFDKNKWPKGYNDSPYFSKTLIIVPIINKKNILGFIILGDKSSGHNFSINNQILLEAIANQVAPAIDNIMLAHFKLAEKSLHKVYIDPFANY